MSTRPESLPYPERLLEKAAVPPLAAGGGDGAWEKLAAKTVQRAQSSKAASPSDTDAWLAAPSLSPEPGEPENFAGESVRETKKGTSTTALPADRLAAASTRAESTMSESERPKPSQRRPSLKELAERVSKTPPPPTAGPVSGRVSSIPGVPSGNRISVPPPSSNIPPAPSAARISAPPPSLDFGRGSVPPAPVSAPPSMLRAASSPPPSASTPSSPPSAAATPVAGPPAEPASDNKVVTAKVVPIDGGGSKSRTPLILLVGAGLAAAAGLFFFLSNNNKQATPTESPTTQAQTTTTAAATVAAETAAPAATVSPDDDRVANAPPPATDDGALDITDLSDASASAPTASGFGTIAPPTTSVAVNDATAKPTSTGPLNLKPDGTLDEAMQKVVGADGKTEEPKPAADNNKARGPAPDFPPQGEVTSALNRVKGSARACVAGADAPSTATVTFSSSGSVSTVSVGGWAQGKPAAACIQSALKAARVNPFLKPSFSTSVTLRP